MENDNGMFILVEWLLDDDEIVWATFFIRFIFIVAINYFIRFMRSSTISILQLIIAR